MIAYVTVQGTSKAKILIEIVIKRVMNGSSLWGVSLKCTLNVLMEDVLANQA